MERVRGCERVCVCAHIRTCAGGCAHVRTPLAVYDRCAYARVCVHWYMGMHECAQTCMYTCTCMCTSACVCISTTVCSCVSVCPCVCRLVFMHGHQPEHACACTCVHNCACKHTFVCACRCTQLCVCACAHPRCRNGCPYGCTCDPTVPIGHPPPLAPWGWGPHPATTRSSQGGRKVSAWGLTPPGPGSPSPGPPQSTGCLGARGPPWGAGPSGRGQWAR